ncbi:MAG: DUF2141 domain-containing protein [Polyangiales bacterium]
MAACVAAGLALLPHVAGCGSRPTAPIVVPASSARAATAATGSLQVRVIGLTRGAGTVRVALYDRATWLDEDHVVAHAQAPVREAETQVSLEHVRAGRYAIAVVDDEDGDGHMSWGAFGPAEPYGFSRGARGTFGPPSFDDAAFDFDGHALVLEVAVK